MTTYADGTYKYVGQGKFERYDREAVGYWVSSTNNIVKPEQELVDAMLYQVTYGADYVGIWTDFDGTRYVDKSHYVRDREVAEASARHWRQGAIWDIANNEAISI